MARLARFLMSAWENLCQHPREEIRRKALLKEADLYIEELVAEVGQPGPETTAHAQAIARRLARRA